MFSLRRRAVTCLVAATTLALVAGACSSGGSDSSGGTTTATSAPAASTTSAPAGNGDPAGRTCDQGATVDKVEAVEVDDPKVPHDWTITSFDGTEIRAHWFPRDGATADEPVPTVLMGPGWSLAGDTSETGDALFGGLAIPGLQDAGYNVLTWDPRGFGESTGTVSVNDPAKEGRDVQVLLDWVAEQPEARTDGAGDPRVGMVGASYGGGIQLTVAAIDCRVDVLAPTIAWHSLETALYRNETVKIGWAGVLLNAATGHNLDPHVKSAYDSGVADGTISDEDQDWFRSRGPGDAIEKVDVPTLFLQGSVDTLFTLDEAITNYQSLRSREVPTAMVWFCGGHGVCLTDPGDGDERVAQATFDWLARYLDGDDSVDTGPAFSTVDQDGTEWSAPDYPVKADAELTATGSGTLELTDEGGSGPAEVPASNQSALGGLVGPITPAPATNRVEVAVDIGDVDGLALGAPQLELSYQGTSPAGDKPVRVFAQLVDDERDVVVGNMATPIALELDGKAHTVTVDLETIAQRVDADRPLSLQLVATTVSYAPGALGGSVTFDDIDLTIPVVTEGLTQVGRQ